MFTSAGLKEAMKELCFSTSALTKFTYTLALFVIDSEP